MHCRDATREISTPTGAVGPEALAAHLAGCRACSAFAAEAAKLDRLLAATRPAPPDPGQWATLWAGLARELDAPAPAPAPAVLAMAPRPKAGKAFRRAGLVAAFALAQAAAVLVAVNLAGRPAAEVDPGAFAPEVAALDPDPSLAPFADIAPTVVDIEPDQFVLLRDDGPGSGLAVVELALGDRPYAVRPDFDVLNWAEAQAGAGWTD